MLHTYGPNKKATWCIQKAHVFLPVSSHCLKIAGLFLVFSFWYRNQIILTKKYDPVCWVREKIISWLIILHKLPFCTIQLSHQTSLKLFYRSMVNRWCIIFSTVVCVNNFVYTTEWAFKLLSSWLQSTFPYWPKICHTVNILCIVIKHELLSRF